MEIKRERENDCKLENLMIKLTLKIMIVEWIKSFGVSFSGHSLSDVVLISQKKIHLVTIALFSSLSASTIIQSRSKNAILLSITLHIHRN